MDGDGNMAQWLQALAILPKDLNNQPPVTPGICCPLASMSIPTHKVFTYTYKSKTVILPAQVSREVGELVINGDSRGELAVT